jgi:hypothetical protein
MDCKTIVELLLTLGIVVFAGLTWLSTRSYSRMAALGLFSQYIRGTMSNENAEVEGSIAALKIVREEFPGMYQKLRHRINENIRARIEQ